MTDRIALGLGLAVVAFLLADFLLFDWAMIYFLMQKFAVLIDWVQFWR